METMRLSSNSDQIQNARPAREGQLATTLLEYEHSDSSLRPASIKPLPPHAHGCPPTLPSSLAADQFAQPDQRPPFFSCDLDPPSRQVRPAIHPALDPDAGLCTVVRSLRERSRAELAEFSEDVQTVFRHYAFRETLWLLDPFRPPLPNGSWARLRSLKLAE
jgi:hypothetical protein